MNSTAMASTASLSLRPSSLISDRSHSPCLPPSSSSSFFSGGTRLWAHRKFISISFSSSQKIPGRRFGRLVVAAAADYYSTLGVPKLDETKEKLEETKKRLAQNENHLATLHRFLQVKFGSELPTFNIDSS